MLPEAPAIIAARRKRSFIRAHHLVRISAKNRTSGAEEALGLWDGEDNQTFSPGNTGPLAYLAAGRILNLPDFQYEAGLDARTYEIGLSQTDQATQIAVREYDPRFGRVLIFRTEWDAQGVQIGTPRLVFQGFIDGSPIETPSFGNESGGITLRIVSDAKILTHYGYHMKSDDFQKKRNNDRFRRYSSVQTSDIPWGMERNKAQGGFAGAVKDAVMNKRPKV